MLDLGEGIEEEEEEEEEEGEGGEGKVAIDESWEKKELENAGNGTNEKWLLYNERFTSIGLYKVLHIPYYTPTLHQSSPFNIILILY